MSTHHIDHSVKIAWLDLPQSFRETHPLPEHGADVGAWLYGLRMDSEHAACAVLDASVMYLARDDVATAKEVAGEARPFREVMRAIDRLAATKWSQR